MLTIKADKISVIQKEFNDEFPFLKLEFFKENQVGYAGVLRPSMITGDRMLKASQKGPGEIQVTEQMPVSILEQLFHDVFGVAAQVFRKSGNTWLETAMTEDWTLKRQNDEGLELSRLKRLP